MKNLKMGSFFINLRVLHPITKICISLLFFVVLISANFLIAICGIILVFLMLFLSGHSGINMAKKFLKILILAGVFLVLIHFEWDSKSINYVSFKSYYQRVISAFGFIILLINLIKPSEISFNSPMLSLVVFNSLFLLRRITTKSKDILIAQQLRGMRIGTFVEKIRALVMILTPLLTSLIYEIEAKSISLYLKGITYKVPKTNINVVKFRLIDFVLIICCVVGIVFIMVIKLFNK